jgi:hypothetical protein
MPSDAIFLKTGDGKLAVLVEKPYDSESVLQEALADHPEVIAGPTTSGDGESRLMLVRREMGVPGAAGGGGTLSLDHLFVDADGVPVLVEVKRSSDTRIRREVVAQMLDYAANGVRYWPVSVLQDSLQRTAENQGRTSEQLLAELRPDLDPGEFWKAVETNLAAGRIRMLLVADVLPPELVRIIEFLNEQMNPAEVLGVELRQYVSGVHTLYVPRVVGRTATAVTAKSSTGGQQWDRELFLHAAAGRCLAVEVDFMRSLLEDVDRRGIKLSWGRGGTPGVGGWYLLGGKPTGMWVLNANSESPTTRAYLVFYLADIAKRLGADRVERAARILQTIPSLETKIAEARVSGWSRYPSLYLGDVASNDAHRQAVFNAIGDLLAAQ